MIIWLASYPKSGNTWVRLFLNSLLYSQDNSVDINNIKLRQFPLRDDFKNLNVDIDNVKEFVENCVTSQNIINLDSSIKIFKTHNALWKTGKHSFTNDKNTAGVIHIVRDPRNIITSVKNHFNKKDYNEAFNFMTNEKLSIGSRIRNNSHDLPTIVSSWSNHYNSWKKMKKNYLLVKYENLLNNPINEFGNIVNYLQKNYQLNFNNNKIQEIIENCNFENLKIQEENSGFRESAKYEKINNKKFFFLGPKNNWKSLLDDKTIKSLELAFKNEMLELSYL